MVEVRDERTENWPAESFLLPIRGQRRRGGPVGGGSRGPYGRVANPNPIRRDQSRVGGRSLILFLMDRQGQLMRRTGCAAQI